MRRTNSLSEAQTRSIGEKLDDIAGAAGRVGRKDWLLMFGGVILSVIMADLLTREVVLEILVVANRGLGDLFDWVGTVPPLSP